MIQLPPPAAYPAYFQTYVDLVPPGDILDTLAFQVQETEQYLRSVGEEKSRHRYQPDRWSIREIVGHLADAERVFCYRALTFARGDSTPLPGFEQDDWVAGSGADSRSLEELTAEFRLVRAATVALFAGMDEESLQRSGTANDNRMVVAAVPFVIAGHELHHRRVIQDRYLGE